MVMSQGTSTFLACFAGFWLVWALVVMLCCFCSVLQRRLKRRDEARPRERCLRTVETETPECPAVPAFAPVPQASPAPMPVTMAVPQTQQQIPREQPPFSPPPFSPPPVPLQLSHLLPEANWVSMPEADLTGNPPCYEEAVLMEDPPPPYAEVLVEPRDPSRDYQDPSPETRKPPPSSMFPERGYSSLIRLPSSQRWDSLGHLLSNMDLKPYNPYEPVPPGVATATMPRQDTRTHRDGGRNRGLGVGFSGGIRRHAVRGLERGCTAFPLLGRSTAV
ncbi:proline-rich protein 7 [Phyllopteryx taeniolatus]|uniref:proline-rich protein 7 n=1 Tax=Phyllopteryx taeniolatus TaxID=161469 RepID=UPI002AD2881B|nr:proline-rich protein 7 [Phyllopteryx taeniolatus]XP_061608920.1 proline-rich protein 7 [Phyllopteryx taeniolatus]XP_061608921.1 proline-rich protein 7 [Phyllopteryx taeniolatus]XP_061608922.1 proline-rich protein 7 [Phyllopteryx taeniolatus]XP_061608923.1 proline-rich protein 7 [Phyllopteryx taeniolatus]XP_061608924.1 proline-rich protein 7 [Phyllopteryx taeniolatus]